VFFPARTITDIETALELLTPAARPHWSQLMSLLSILYAEDPDGKQDENIERAIRAADAALTIVNPSGNLKYGSTR
jgi:hypothetical protein